MVFNLTNDNYFYNNNLYLFFKLFYLKINGFLVIICKKVFSFKVILVFCIKILFIQQSILFIEQQKYKSVQKFLSKVLVYENTFRLSSHTPEQFNVMSRTNSWTFR